MTDDKDQFVTLERKERRVGIFGYNGKEKIIEIGKIIITSSTFIENMSLVGSLKYNLLSIS